MWVKLSGLDGVPSSYVLDADNRYDWKTALEVAAALNGASPDGASITPVPGNAFHTDWRLPNVAELSTIADWAAPGCGTAPFPGFAWA